MAAQRNRQASARCLRLSGLVEPDGDSGLRTGAAGFASRTSCAGEVLRKRLKTFAVPVARLFASWNDAKLRATWLPDSTKITVRKANANKSMRITWHDDTRVEVNFWDKGSEKSQAAVEHRKLESQQDVARVKEYWSSALNGLKELLETEAAPKPAAKTIRKKAAIKKASK